MPALEVMATLLLLVESNAIYSLREIYIIPFFTIVLIIMCEVPWYTSTYYFLFYKQSSVMYLTYVH